MLSMIISFPQFLYTAIASFIRDLKEDERGLSGVVVTILLILVAVLAIILIWGLLGDWLNELWITITDKGSTFT